MGERNKHLTLRLTSREWEKLHERKGDKSISKYVRDAITAYARNEEREINAFLKRVENIDMVYVMVKQLESQIESLNTATVRLLELLQSKQGGGLTDEDKKQLANIVYILTQIHDRRGWNSLQKEQQSWLVKAATEK